MLQNWLESSLFPPKNDKNEKISLCLLVTQHYWQARPLKSGLWNEAGFIRGVQQYEI